MLYNEAWDTSPEEWVTLDIANDEYLTDESGTPLSALDIRRPGAGMALCTPVKPGESAADPLVLREGTWAASRICMKNMAYMRYCETCMVGETEPLVLPPLGPDDPVSGTIPAKSAERSPLQ